MKSFKPFLLSAAVILFLGLITAMSANATSVVKLNFDQIMERSEIILSGKVINIENKVEILKEKKVPFTYVTVSILDKIKGDFNHDTYTVSFQGGVIPEENLGLVVGSMPNFQVGQEVFLFLNGDETLLSPFVGFFQGRFHIKTDEKSGIKHIYDNGGNPVTEGFVTGNPDNKSTDPVTYEYFRNLLKNKVK